MRLRNASYADYGLGEEECAELLRKCQNAGSETEKLLFMAAQESNEGMAADLFYSLRRGISFERLETANKLLYTRKEDFYAYRKKALYLFSEKLQEQDGAVTERMQNDGYIRRYCSIKSAAGELGIGKKEMLEIAAKADAVVKIGRFVRINMIALYRYIDRECAAGSTETADTESDTSNVTSRN